MVVVSILIPLTALVVGLRFYARQRLDNWIGLDDWGVLIALVSCQHFSIRARPLRQDPNTCFAGFYYSEGHHSLPDGPGGTRTAPVEPHRYADRAVLQSESSSSYRVSAVSTNGQQRFYFAIILYYCALGSIKIALLLQYRRIFGSKLRRVINIALLIIGSWSVGLVMLSIFTCHPIRGYWEKETKATCIPTFQWYIHSAGNILSDIVIFTLPIPLLWSMKVSMRQRLLLILVFSLGLL